MSTDVSRNRALFIVLLTLIAGAVAGFRNGREQGYEVGFKRGTNEMMEIAARACAERLMECKSKAPAPQPRRLYLDTRPRSTRT